MKSEVQERLQLLREKMKACGIDAYLVVSDDFHSSEYVGDYFKCREYLSGFDGSAGSLIILKEEAGLWTDGRYFLQAEEQLKGTGITLYKSGEEGVPDMLQFLREHIEENQTLGFDGRTVNSSFYQKIRKTLPDSVKLLIDKDLAGEVWSDRPELSMEPVWILPDRYAGQSRQEKISQIRGDLAEEKADYLVLTSLDDIAWLLNVRGGDVLYNPVVLSYLVLGQESVTFFVQKGALDEEVKRTLREDGVEFRDYHEFYDSLEEIEQNKTVLVDPGKVNAAVIGAIPGGVKIKEHVNLTLLPKAVKNSTETENEISAHIKDGVAVTKLLFWLKHRVGKERITELTVAEKLEEFRKQGEHYLGQSFAPISAYGPHGAIVHYEPTEQTDVELHPESFLLLDTGGQYLEGTTDITRTIALGTPTEEQKKYYTAVLKGNLNLAAARFKYGCHGINLDYLAREPLWEMGMDYNHGTGHGVGYLLNVHEGPNAFRYREAAGNPDLQILREGMITSDEPGLYLAGKYGIRLENLLLCKKEEKTEYGQFMEFQTLTMVPFDLDAVEPHEMTETEKRRLNEYHGMVYETISPYLDEDERKWLREATREI